MGGRGGRSAGYNKLITSDHYDSSSSASEGPLVFCIHGEDGMALHHCYLSSDYQENFDGKDQDIWS